MSEAKRVELTVPPAAAGRRLDRYLADTLEPRSRSTITRWIREGRVRIDGDLPGKPGAAVAAGARVEVVLPPPPERIARAERIDVTVLFEDEAIVVVDKPAGLVVHPGHGVPDGTLVNALLGRGIALAAVGGELRPGIVHRLDRETSGVIVVAKTDAAHRELARAFAERRVRKRYVALVWGKPDPPEGTIDRGIGRSRANPTKMSVRGTRGARRAARTHYRTVETMPGFALLDVLLETGRTHQIRVHLQSLHHPVVGDLRYGGRAWRGLQDTRKRAAVKRFPGLALHAAELSLAHPVDGREVVFRAPLPRRMERLLAALREEVR